ncbi:ABC transporter substrate-binding protein [Deinococcus sp.]|uniref:ABC transporter substrate-binding protein n=1 Tax=Deinococcus sp. TaxID=47478 RepID=UPI0025C59908|nr:ABC transporter substrate-binding protein [Deinococcus sp.]
MRLNPLLVQPLLVLAALTSVSQATAARYPLTVTDDLGRQITLNSEPKKIIAMLPSHTETLFAIGAGRQVVAVDRFSNAPSAAARLPRVGTAFQPDLESILALKPDLVLADDSRTSKLTGKLEAAGLTVYGGSAQTYNDVFSKIAMLGKLTNHDTWATRLITSMRSELGTLQKSVIGRPKISVYYEVDPAPYSVGPNSFIGVLLQKAGGQTIVPAKLGDFPKIDPELIVKANPQVIIGLTLDEAKKRPGWSNISAVKTGRVYKASSEENDAIVRPGPRLPQALRTLIRMIHPEALK